MWWRRRPRGALGAPPALAQPPRLAAFVVALVVALGVFLPILGVSLILVLIAERLIRRFAPGAGCWLGLRAEGANTTGSSCTRLSFRASIAAFIRTGRRVAPLWRASSPERCATYDLPGGWPRPPGANRVPPERWKTS